MRLLLELLLPILLVSYQGGCQVTDTVARDQPDMVWFTQTSTCCQHNASPTDLMNCVNKLSINNGNNRVAAVVTYVSGGIYEYAAYALTLQAAYSEHNDYVFRIQTAENGNNFEPIDQRWNKVKIMRNALDLATGWAKDVDYIVWLDADLVILDMGMRLELVGREHPEADVIMSNDLGGSLDFANSGFVLVRNTDWAREFLDKWWDCDRPRMSDQMAFLLLQDRLPAQDRKKIKLLPIDAVNTHFPPWEFQRDCNQVLHLAGETDSYRRVVFESGLRTLCAAIDPGTATGKSIGARHLPQQLGLTKKVLRRFHEEKGGMRVSELRKLREESIQGLAALENDTLKAKWNHISRIKGKVSNVLKDAEMEVEQKGMSQEFYELTLEVLRWCFTHFKTLALATCRTVQTESVEAGELVRMAISTAYDIMDFHGAFHRFLSNPSGERHLQIVEMLQGVETELMPVFRAVLPARLYPKARYYDLKFFQFLSAARQMAGAPPIEVLATSMRAIEVWRELHTQYQYYGTDYLSIDPLKEGSRLIADTAVRYCSEVQDVGTGVALFREAQTYMVQTLEGYDHNALATVHNKADEVMALIYAYSNCAICIFSAGATTDDAVRDVVTSIEYIHWYQHYSTDEGKELPLELVEHEKRLQYILRDVGSLKADRGMERVVDIQEQLGVKQGSSSSRMMRRKKKKTAT